MSRGLNGVQVVSFESRMSQKMERLIAQHGGLPIIAAAMQEISLDHYAEVFVFGKCLLDRQVDVVIFMTGTGTQRMFEVLESRYDKTTLLDAFKRVTISARGPKPMRVLRQYGLSVTVPIPQPSTWREIIEALDLSQASAPLYGKTVAIQEYGLPNEDLIQALKERHAEVLRIPVYRWALPENIEPLREAVRRIIAGDVSLVLITNATQIRHVFQFAVAHNLEQPLRRALERVVIASIGPTSSEAITAYGLRVHFQASSPTMDGLLAEVAQGAEVLIPKKQPATQPLSLSVSSRRSELADSKTLREKSIFMQACHREPTSVTPIWLMRQAGRYLKEYREIRQKVPFLELCKTPELAAEVAVSAVGAIGADAAILFSDILLIVEPMGLSLEYGSTDGPVISGQVASIKDVDTLAEINPQESLGFVFEAVSLTRAALDPHIPLIGFSGAPFTLASYVIEGGSSKAFVNTKRLMYTDPGAWHALMEKISRGLVRYLNGQIEAGADALQLFDSWVGCLGPEDYRKFVLPHTKAVLDGIKPNVPVIHFGTGTASFLSDMKRAGGHVIGVDFRVELDWAWQILGCDVGVQGNLDPVVLCGPRDYLRERVRQIVVQAAGHTGHIFNLGHGVLPQTPEDNVRALIDDVHTLSRR